MITRLERQKGTETAHILKSQEQTLLACLKDIRHKNHSLPGEPRIDIVSMLGT